MYNYYRQNFMCQGDGLMRFRTEPIQEIKKESNRIEKKLKEVIL